MAGYRWTTTAIATGVILIFFTADVFSLEVDVDEIRTKKVKFINYRGKQRKADPVKDIYDIGRKLARRTIKNNRATFYTKYSIIRAISKKEPEKFSADIFSVDRDARVNHIKNIRRITTAYLIEMYGYNRRNARTLSLFLSYYNAVHRGDITYFGSKYKAVVMRYINAKNAGIGTRYWEWPGRTRMLIPLTEEAKRGKIDSVDPDIISDKDTKDQIRKDDRNIPERKDLADIKDRKLKKDKKKLEDEKKELDKEKKKLDKEKEVIRKKEGELKKKEEDTRKITDPEKRKEKEKEIDRETKDLDKKKETIKKKESTIKKREKKTSDREKTIKKRESGLKKERDEIKKDEKKRDEKKDKEKQLIEKEKELDKREDKLRDKELDKKIYGTKLYYMKINEYLQGGHYNNDMLMINAETQKVLFKSPVKNICGRRYDIFSGGVVVITHRGSHTSGHRLTLLDRDSLAAKITGTDDIFWRSFIEIREGSIYAIMYDNGKYHLGRFDSNLKLVAKSKERIAEDTFISIYGDIIYINRYDKKIIVLNKKDLSLKAEVKP